jgi:hypothetical protein
MPQVENTDSVFVNSDELYNKKINPVPVPERKKEIDLEKTLYDNIIQAGFSSQLDIHALDSLNQNAESRNQMYNLFDTMCEDGSIGAVVETYAEDATERNDKGSIVWVEAPDSKVAQFIEFLIDTLNVDKNIYKWVYSLCKYGDLYLRLYRESEYNDDLFCQDKDTSKQLNEELTQGNSQERLDEDIKIKSYSKNDGYVHYMEMVSNPAEMFELTKFGKTVGYVKAPVTSTIVKQDNTSFNTFKYKFKKDDITLFPATEFVHAALEDNINREEETVSIFLKEEDYNTDKNAYSYTVRKGQSLLSSVFKTWRNLNLLENSVLLNRITKSSIVRLINVEVGDMPKENVGKTLLGIKNMVEQKAAINQGSSMAEYTNPGPIENNVYVPTHGGVGTISTTQIGGDVDVKSLADLDYYMNKLYGQLRVPKQYFSQTDDSTGFNGGTSLSIISSRYAKMIKRIQNTVIQALTDAINLMLLDKGLDSYINEFTIHMLPPTTQEEIDRRDNLSSKVQLTSDIMNMLAEIEDPTAKLKILKTLLANVITDTEIIQILQDEIDRLENDSEEPPIEDIPEEGMEGAPAGEDFMGDFGADIGELPEEGAETSEESGDSVLPSPEDMGVDLTNADEE